MFTDLRFALRQLAKFPGFTLVAVLSLAVGIGTATAIFSLLNAVLLRALPVRAPHELRLINWSGLNPRLRNYTGAGTSSRHGGALLGSSFPYPAYREFRERAGKSGEVFAFFPVPRVTALARGEAMVTSGLMVSDNFFAGYGASTLLGRPLTTEDGRPGAAPATVITYGMWERSFGLDPHALGQTVFFNQSAFTIVGVLPPDYVGPLLGDMADFYVSFAAQPTLAPTRPLDSYNQWWVQIMARLSPTANETQVQAALAVSLRQALAASTTKMDQPDIVLEDGAQGAGAVMRARMATPLLLLLAIVAVVVLIACANVAGLMLARGAARQHEFAVRAAIGASRWQLIRQLLTESLVLALAAAMGGLLIASWGKAALLGIFGGMPDNFRIDLRTDLTVLAFTLVTSVLTAVGFGLLPALHASRVDAIEGLKSRAALAAPRLRLGKVLVSVQVGLSVLLVVGAGLLIRTFVNLVRVDPGLQAENVLLFRVAPSQVGLTGEALARFYREARRAIAAIPGVRSVALANMTLLAGDSSSNGIEIPDRPAQPGEVRQANELYASDGFFATLGIPLVLGREFTEADTATSLPVAVVNETFARRYFPGENPLGRTFQLAGQARAAFTIVGVSRDAKYASIREAVPPVMCFCSQQREMRALVFTVRSALPPLSLVPAARKAIAALNPNLPLSAVRTQAQWVENSTAIDRLFAGLCSGLAVVALLLACIGLYGLMAYQVARRTTEIGVRMALGATRREIAWPIVQEALRLATVGLGIGLPVALVLTQAIKKQLYGVPPYDPATLGAGAMVLLTIAALAAWLPARRAAAVDPMTALRAE
jgi:predicted permease